MFVAEVAADQLDCPDIFLISEPDRAVEQRKTTARGLCGARTGVRQ